MTKDQWIQKAKALLFDFCHSAAERSLKNEAQELIDQAGGYDYMIESSETELQWREE